MQETGQLFLFRSSSAMVYLLYADSGLIVAYLWYERACQADKFELHKRS